MSLSLGTSALSECVNDGIETVVPAAIARLAAPAPCASHSPPAPEALPDSTAPAALIKRRTQPGRACIARTRERIQATLEWESCDEDSGRFRAIAQQFDEAFEKENLDDEEGSEDASDESASGSGSEDDDAYESSFVDDGSGSEDESDEAEWTPRKRACARSKSASPALEGPSAGFLHMEEFAGLPPAGRAEPAGAAPDAAGSDADAASFSEADAASFSEADAASFSDADAASFSEADAASFSAADAAAGCDADAAAGCDAAAGRFLHAEELDSPPGFYNLWVL